MSACPLCSTPASGLFRDTPYHVCPSCRCWFQDPAPPKRYTGPHEIDVDKMSEHDKAVNAALARFLFDRMPQKPAPTLDIGSRYPYLAHSLAELGCEAFALEHESYNHDLNVTPIVADFEAWEYEAEFEHRFGLITLVHVFEHFSKPLFVLDKLRRKLRPDGRVFIRMPDHDVDGFERDLTPGHYTIHPFYHCLESILEACSETRFAVEWTEALKPGQRDLILRPIEQSPRLGVAMIVKNEERDLPAALESIAPVADFVAIADTGSTDKTVEVARTTLDRAGVPHNVHTCLGASEKDASGDWKLWDFSKARNQSLLTVEKYWNGAGAPDWVIWLDGDDRVTNARSLRRAMFRDDVDVYMIPIKSGGHTWFHHRMWRVDKGVRFKGRCHEYPVIDGLRQSTMDVIIEHKPDADASQEDSNPRNLRILMREWEKDGPNPRTAFYIANTYRDGRQYEKACEWYEKRVEFGQAFKDEYLFAILYWARCLFDLTRFDDAIRVLERGLVDGPDWCELRLERAYNLRRVGRYSEAIGEAEKCVGATIPPTLLWREIGKYRDQPAALVSLGHEEKGRLKKALAWSVRAQSFNDSPEARANSLRLAGEILDRPKAPPMGGPDPFVAMVRPGAIGDVLMTLNLLPAFKQAYPDVAVDYYTEVAGLHDIIAQAGARRFSGSPRDAAYAYRRTINLVGYPLNQGYPDKPMQRHLLQYFAEEMGLYRIGEGNGLPQLTLRKPPRPAFAPKGDYVTIQTKAGWSKYKQWSAFRWGDLFVRLREFYGISFATIDESDGHTLEESIALFANARMHIGIDSFCNHLTNYLWRDGTSARRVPGVILWGSTQASAAGYPDNVNISKGLACQPCFRENPAVSKMPRGPCINPPRETYDDPTPHACMDSITVAEVIDAAVGLWERS